MKSLTDLDHERKRLARQVLSASGCVANPARYLAGLMRLSIDSLHDRLRTIKSQHGLPMRRNLNLNLALVLKHKSC